MRILFANDGISDVGGVHAYLVSTAAALERRGHSIALAYCSDSGSAEAASPLRRYDTIRIDRQAPAPAFAAISRWAPDICYSHNMNDLSVDRAMAAAAPVVKFMHGYFGTCIGGLKMHAFPQPVPCDRAYGSACLALYLPRRCGQLSPATFLKHWRWTEQQRGLFATYAAIVVASDHMRREYIRSGVDASAIAVNGLFPTEGVPAAAAPMPGAPHVAFLGRMTPLKGGDLLIRAIAHARRRLGARIKLTMIGDGPQAAEWKALAAGLDVGATFTGWVNGARRWTLLSDASVIALPGAWPEPFGLVGLEAGALGIPAVAIDTGGVSEWLRDEVNGVAVPAPVSAASFGDALAAVLGDAPRLARLRAGARRVAEEMSIDAHVSRLERIFHGVRPAAVAS
jgi:glycosyltransferase involved in cell wall biosynthesis